MARLTWLDAALIGGGVIITAVGIVVVVRAKVTAPAPTPIPVPTPAPTPVPGIPAAIEMPAYPTSLSQLYGFYYWMASPVSPQFLYVNALTSFMGPPYPQGGVTAEAVFRVVDAAGRGVPNVAVLVWSVPTRDDQSGILLIDDVQRSEVEALRLLTLSNGEVHIRLGYQLTNIKILEDRHSFGCCVPWGRAGDIDVGQSCELPPPLAWICYRQRDARTDPKVYTVNARIEGTIKTNAFGVTCQAIGKALW